MRESTALQDIHLSAASFQKFEPDNQNLRVLYMQTKSNTVLAKKITVTLYMLKFCQFTTFLTISLPN